MGEMTKLIVLMTLVAVSFLPQDGVDAIRCYDKSHLKVGETNTTCPSDEPQLCVNTTHRIEAGGTLFVGRHCFHGIPAQVRAEVGCQHRPARDGEFSYAVTYCICDKDFCNSDSGPPPGFGPKTPGSGCTHAQPSSVLSPCVVTISLAISSFGSP